MPTHVELLNWLRFFGYVSMALVATGLLLGALHLADVLIVRAWRRYQVRKEFK